MCSHALSTGIAVKSDTTSKDTVINFVIVNVSFSEFLGKVSGVVNRVTVVVL
jgi:hypothetical protein